MVMLPIAAPPAELLLMMAAWLVEITIADAGSLSQAAWLKAVPVYLTTAKLIMLASILFTILPLPTVRRRALCRVIVLLTLTAATFLLQIRLTDFLVIAFNVGQEDAPLVSLKGKVY